MAGNAALCDANSYPTLVIGDTDYNEEIGLKGGTRIIEEQDNPEKGLCPDFFRLYELDCGFPDNYHLRIFIKHKSAFASYFDKEIGELCIDLEDRWYGDIKMK